jgi:cyclohexa-1,5-dienecarbonyl-CoA hydratase
MCLTGANFAAAELHRLGLVNRVTDAGALDGTVTEFIEKQILPKSASSIRLACRAARGGIAAHYNARIKELESLYLEDLMGTADAVEGITAFLEKRKPQWKDA